MLSRPHPWAKVKKVFGYSDKGEKPLRFAPEALAALLRSSFDDLLSMYYYDMMHLEVDRFERYKEFDTMDCWTADTRVSLVNGETKPIEELVDKDPFWVYAYDHKRKKVVPAKAIAHKTRKNAELVQVKLDNGEELQCTPDHKFMFRDGSYKRAEDLEAGDSLMPLYRKYNHSILSGYELLYQPTENTWHFTHRQFVCKSGEIKTKEIVHHKDFDKRNNCPENLEYMTRADHTKLHCTTLPQDANRRRKISETSKGRKYPGRVRDEITKKKISATLSNQWNDPDFRDRRLKAIRTGTKRYITIKTPEQRSVAIQKGKTPESRRKTGETTKKRWADPTYRGRVVTAMKHSHNMTVQGRKILSDNAKLLWADSERKIAIRKKMSQNHKSKHIRELVAVNHRVVSVQFLEQKEDTYCLLVEKYHNFALGAGVFVHNCDDIITQCLDLFAEDAVQPEVSSGKTIWVEAEDKEIEDICNRKLEELKVEDTIFAVARELAKYGDSYTGMVQSEKTDGTPGEIVDLMPAPVYTITRIEDETNRLKGWLIFPIEATTTKMLRSKFSSTEHAEATDPPWAIVHFKLLGKNRLTSYGSSFLMASRRMFRKLRLCEDNLVLYRLKRAPDRFVYSIKGLASMTPEDRKNAMRKIRQEMRKKFNIDTATGRVKTEMDPVGIEEDIIVDSEAVDVTRLTGSQQINAVLDIEYLRKRFLGTIGIPPDYLGFSDTPGSFAAEIPLSYQDINFARKEKRLQKALMEGYTMILILNLCWINIDPFSERAKFTLHMSVVSATDERQRLEVEKIRVETLKALEEIGKMLGIEGEEWIQYLLTRSMIPVHLFRKNGKEISGIIKGKVNVIERAARLNHLSGKFLTESRCKQIEEFIDSKLDKEKKDFLNEFFLTSKNIFNSRVGPNTYHSERLAINMEDFPYRYENSEGILVENKLMTEWESKEKGEEVKKTKNLMSETVKKIIKESKNNEKTNDRRAS